MDSVAYERTKADFIAVCKAFQSPFEPCANAEQLAYDFDEVCADPRLRYFGVKNGTVYLVTYPLIIRSENSGKAYGPAEYIVQVNIAAKTILCENVEGVRVNHEGGGSGHHPHVNSEGTPCLGENLAWINTQIVRGRLAKVCVRMLDFLEIAGTSHYISPHMWNEMNEEEIQQCLKLRRAGTK